MNSCELKLESEHCAMCGARAGDYWETRVTRPVKLELRSRAGDAPHCWTICDECHEGTQRLQRRFRRGGSFVQLLGGSKS